MSKDEIEVTSMKLSGMLVISSEMVEDFCGTPEEQKAFQDALSADVEAMLEILHNGTEAQKNVVMRPWLGNGDDY